MEREKRAVYEFGEFRLDSHRRLLTRIGGERLALTGKAFDALVYLVERAGEPVTRKALTDALWPSTVVEENNLSQAISVLRRTLGEGAIATIARRGYQFTADVRVVPPNELAPSPAAPAEPPRSASSAAPTRVRRAARLAALLGSAAAAAAIGVGAFWLLPQRAVRLDPLEGYAFSKLTEFDGVEEQAAISRDGRLVAFLRQRRGDWDVWVGQIGTGQFQNLTRGAMRELRNPAVRTLGFFPDASHLVIWSRIADPEGGGDVNGGWALPILGGQPRPWRIGIAELDWSPDGERIAFHTAAAGDPLFVGNVAGPSDDRLIHAAPAGVHAHFPVWSRDGRFLYFVRGNVPDEMDVWRVRIDAADAQAEQLTYHDSQVSFPTILDVRTLLYLATDEDGSGPWIWALDLGTLASRRIDTRGQAYASLAASVDGRRVVATQLRSTASFWRASLGEAAQDPQDLRAIDVPTPRVSSPRFGPRFLAYRATSAGSDGIWKLENGAAMEVWSEPGARITAGAAVARDGRLAFCVSQGDRTQLYVVNADGRGARQLAVGLDVLGAPDWSPDASAIAISALLDGVPRLVMVPADGGEPIVLTEAYAMDPAWSPSGRFIVYSGADVGTNFALGAVNADGTPHSFPEIVLSRGSRRIDFLDEDLLVMLKGSLAEKELWLVDLRSGEERPLTALGPGPLIRDFDISHDGREIVLERVREESDIVLIERTEDGTG